MYVTKKTKTFLEDTALALTELTPQYSVPILPLIMTYVWYKNVTDNIMYVGVEVRGGGDLALRLSMLNNPSLK